MELGIKKAIDGGNGNTIIYTALLAAMAANAIPTIADPIYFKRVNKLERQFERGEITAEKLEWHVTAEYYLWTAGFYGVLFLGIYSFGGTYKSNAKLLLALLSAGLVVGVVQQNIKADKEIQKLKTKN